MGINGNGRWTSYVRRMMKERRGLLWVRLVKMRRIQNVWKIKRAPINSLVDKIGGGASELCKVLLNSCISHNIYTHSFRALPTLTATHPHSTFLDIPMQSCQSLISCCTQSPTSSSNRSSGGGDRIDMDVKYYEENHPTMIFCPSFSATTDMEEAASVDVGIKYCNGEDAYSEYVRWMGEMILENMTREKEWKIEEILDCYLFFNHPLNHTLIKMAFADVVISIAHFVKQLPISPSPKPREVNGFGNGN